jgi:transcription antitermination factor NusG
MAWCILRTGGSKTLSLADALKQSGYEVWTPRETIRKRLPRRKAKAEHTAPIMPTFVFAHAKHLSDLAALAQSWKNPHPDFSVQRYNDRYPLIADDELRPLRMAERKGTPLEHIKTFDPGEQIRLTEGGFAGMSGIVQTSDGKHTMVCFPGFNVPIKISTLLLLGEMDMQAEMAA